MKNNVSIIVVNYNGVDLLKVCLPTIIDACVFSNLTYEIVVVDNGSTDGSLDFVYSEYPNFLTLPMRVNNHWFSVNNGIYKSSYDHLLLLNNDVKLDRYCIKYLFEHFKDDNAIFAVTPKEMGWGGAIPTKGAQAIEVKNEAIFPHMRSFYFDKPHITFKADNSMYAKDKLIKLGLFDPIFSPFYYEDVDISYRAWKTGFQIIYEPKAIIYHKSGATIDKYATMNFKIIYGFKNSLLFIWKNITDKGLFFNHIIFLISRLMKSILFFHGANFLLGFILAMKSLKAVVAARRKATVNFVLTDRDILHTLNVKNFYEKDRCLPDKSSSAE